MKKNTVNNFPQEAGDGYEVANWLAGRPIYGPGPAGWPQEAAEAYRQMKAAGWTFDSYNDCGEPIFRKPEPVDGFFSEV
jgi:hypothetical protein